MENYVLSPMVLAIFVFCLIGCGVHSYHIGKNHGIESTVEYLVDQGVLQEVSEDEE
jgi:hypothetical protein